LDAFGVFGAGLQQEFKGLGDLRESLIELFVGHGCCSLSLLRARPP
jgi:hypothetical protein